MVDAEVNPSAQTGVLWVACDEDIQVISRQGEAGGLAGVHLPGQTA